MVVTRRQSAAAASLSTSTPTAETVTAATPSRPRRTRTPVDPVQSPDQPSTASDSRSAPPEPPKKKSDFWARLFSGLALTFVFFAVVRAGHLCVAFCRYSHGNWHVFRGLASGFIPLPQRIVFHCGELPVGFCLLLFSFCCTARARCRILRIVAPSLLKMHHISTHSSTILFYPFVFIAQALSVLFSHCAKTCTAINFPI